MRLAYVGSGTALLIFGIAAFTGLIPLAGITNVTLSSATANCTTANLCSASVIVQNNGEVTLPINVYFVVKNNLAQTVFTDFNPVNPPIGTAVTVNDNLGSMVYPPNTYTLTIFATNVVSQPDSNTVTIPLQTSSVILTVSPGLSFTGGTISLNPSGSPGPAANSFYFPNGASVTATFNPGQGTNFVQWLYSSNGRAPFTTSSSPSITLTLSGPLYLNANYTAIGATNVIPFANCGGASIAPSTPQQVSPTSSPTFTETPGNLCTFSGWALGKNLGTGVTVGNATSITVTTAMLQSAGRSCTTAQSCPDAYLTAQFRIAPTIVLTSTPGITTTPSPGTYHTVGSWTVSEFTLTGYCFTGWTVNGVFQSQASSLTITTVSGQNYYVGAQGVIAPSGGCGSLPPPPPSGLGGLSIATIVGAVSSIGGLGLIFLGLRPTRGRRRR